MSRCKLCDRAHLAAYRKANPRRVKNKNFKDRYGITVDEYEAMKNAQDGRCRICLATGRVLYVDHCHNSGKIRGLLCSQCNSGLGMLKDSSVLVKRALDYLRIYGA